jgi:AraC-like DNA-binding protein
MLRQADEGAGAPLFAARRSLVWGAGAPTRARRGAPRAPCGSFATHEHAAVAFAVGGRSRIEQRERWTLEAGDVVLIPSGEPHRWLELERLECWTLGFCVPCFAADDAGSLLEPFERVRQGASAVVRVPTDRHAFLESLFRELALATEPGRAAASLVVQRSLLTLVLNEVSGAARWDESGLRPPGIAVESLRFIERNCLRPLTLDDVARAVGKNASYVTSALSRATGRSAVEWIIAGRMAEARRRLLHSDERIDAIAERVGYADATHFIRLFRREHGATPAAWRAARRGPALSI